MVHKVAGEKLKATALLKKDHDKIRGLFKQFEDAKSVEDRQGIVENALIELTVHSTLEEEIFYPAVREELGEDELMSEAEEEHHLMKILIVEIAQMEPDDDRYAAKFKVLAETVRHHMAEEERRMLSRVERSDMHTEALRDEMESRREELLDEIYRPTTVENPMTGLPEEPFVEEAPRPRGARLTRA